MDVGIEHLTVLIIGSFSILLHHSEFDIEMADMVACRPCLHRSKSKSKAERIETQQHVTG